MKVKKKDPQKTREQREYEALVRQKLPPSRTFLQCVKAFISGGIICCIGQAIADAVGCAFTLTEAQVATVTSMILVFIGAFLTGIGVYDKIGKFCGAGSIVPITGFANSIVAPAMEFKQEGYVMGIGANLFTIAGPVLVYGTTASVIVGIIYYIYYAVTGVI